MGWNRRAEGSCGGFWRGKTEYCAFRLRIFIQDLLKMCQSVSQNDTSAIGLRTGSVNRCHVHSTCFGPALLIALSDIVQIHFASNGFLNLQTKPGNQSPWSRTPEVAPTRLCTVQYLSRKAKIVDIACCSPSLSASDAFEEDRPANVQDIGAKASCPSLPGWTHIRRSLSKVQGDLAV